MKKYDDSFLTELCIKSNIEFISGKYFYNGNEIKNIDKYLSKIYYSYAHKFINERDLNYMKTGIINNPLMEDEKTKWPRPRIIDEALELKASGYEPKECPFPLEEKQLIILYVLLFHPEYEAFFITTGIGGSGKSSFMNIVKQLFDNDVSATPLAELKGFQLAEALKHRIICSDEIGKGDIDLPIIKTIVSKQPISVNEKYGATYTTLAQSALFFSCNQAPKIDISDSGMLRRIIFYSRNTKIINPNPALKDKKWTHEELIDFVLWAMKVEFLFKEDDIDHWKFPFKMETNYYLCNTNSVGIFYGEAKKMGYTKFNYSTYRDYCLQNSYKPFNKQNYEDILEWVVENYVSKEMLENQSDFILPI